MRHDANTETADVVCVASWNADMIARVARPIARGETLMASAFSISPGGKGSNAAVAAARQGARVALIARIGDDDFGQMGMDLWNAEGIATVHVERAAGERSGVAQILVYDDGDNSIAVYPGAGAGLGAGHALAAAELLAHCRVVMASCEVPVEATLAAFRLARQAHATTLLNPAPARSLPMRAIRATRAPWRAAATAALLPLPPGLMLKALAISVSPRAMGRATREIMSAFQLATQTTSTVSVFASRRIHLPP